MVFELANGGRRNFGIYINDQQETVAHYEYDSFGNTVASSGDNTDYFEHRFSTKPIDEATGFYYYGYRYHDPMTGRWPNRDPITEQGGWNLYGFLENDSVDNIDVWGLNKCDICEEVKKRVDTWDKVQKLRSLERPKYGKCLTSTSCEISLGGFTGATYIVDSGAIKVACCVQGKKRTKDQIQSSFRHELSHAASLCRKLYADCDGCMEEEKKAYKRAGQCTTKEHCTDLAWNSCGIRGTRYCSGKHLGGVDKYKKEDYINKYNYNGPDIPETPEQ